MSEFSKSLAISTSALTAQATRLRHIAENIAHVDTPGFRRKSVSFEAVRSLTGGAEQVAVGRVQLDQSDLTRIHDPSHPLSDETGHFFGSNVNLMLEIADAREAQRSYEANLKMFAQARQMSSSLNDLLRK